MPATSPPFVVYALPRSRSFWLSRFLSANGWTCGHDEARHVRSLKDVKAWLSLPLYGTVETAAAPFWRLVQELRPDIRTVVLRRPVDQVINSFIRTGLTFDVPRLQREIQKLDRKLDQIAARVPGALSVTFDELADEAVCARVFEHCLSLPHDPEWYARAAPLNLQINLAALMRYYAANVGELQTAARSAGRHMRAKLMARPVTSAEFTFAQEPLSVLLCDGAPLIGEHFATVSGSSAAIAMGERPVAPEARGCRDPAYHHGTAEQTHIRLFDGDRGAVAAVGRPHRSDAHQLLYVARCARPWAEAPTGFDRASARAGRR